MNKKLLLKGCKTLILLVLLVAVSFALKANPVDLNYARTIGAKFVNANMGMKMTRANDLKLVSTYQTTKGMAAFYIFNVEHGFVIVSADDCATPILGYSDEGKFDINNIPIQMQDYLAMFVEQIEYGIEHHVVDEVVAKEWESVKIQGTKYGTKGDRVVTPLLGATIWNQNCYYNNLCPSDSQGPCGHVYAGCVATAMGQVMHYWGYPEHGTGSHSYTPSGYSTQTVNFGAATYNWDLMPDYITSSSSSNQINEIAKLLWHCGVAVDMMYGNDGSGAYSVDVPYALINYFNYSDDLYGQYKDNTSTWLAAVKSNLDLGYPLYYSGSDVNGGGGHAFVCDGYDANNMLHFNWGWSGSGNNYFSVDALNVGNYQFNNYCYAIFNMHPIGGVVYHEISAYTNPAGAGSVEGAGSYIEGSNCTLTAFSGDHYRFLNWTKNGMVVSTGSTITFVVTEDATYVANFEQMSDDVIDFHTGDFSQYAFTNDASYPWTVVSEGGNHYAKSGNGGVASSTSSLTATHTFATTGFISFDFAAYGEGSDSYDWDKCRFYIDGNMVFDYGNHDMWESILETVAAGSHTFTWTYKKDSSVNPTGDYFAIDNIIFAEGDPCVAPATLVATGGVGGATITWGGEATSFTVGYKPVTGTTWTEVSGVEGHTYTITGLEAGNYDVRVQADCDPGNYATGSFTVMAAPLSTANWYGYTAYADEHGDKIVTFSMQNISTVTEVMDPGQDIYAAEYANGYVWFIGQGDGALYKAALDNEAQTIGMPMQVVSGFCSATATEMSYNPVDGLMYFIASDSGSSTLNSFDPANPTAGATTICTNDEHFFAFAINSSGVAYGIQSTGDLFTINLTTGAATLVGSTGVECSYVQTMAFDPETNELFWAQLLDLDSYGLYSVDVTTGAAGYIGVVGSVYEFTGLFGVYGSTAGSTIDDVMVDGFVAPQYDGHPNFSVSVPSAAHYSVQSVNWYKNGVAMTTSDVFNDESANYYMVVDLAAESGYEFGDNVSVFFNGDLSVYDAANSSISGGVLHARTITYQVVNATMYTFDDNTMEGWTTIDADGDGYTWVLGSECNGIYLDGGSLAGSGHNSSADLVTSGSYSNVVGVLTPDNFLVSPTKAAYTYIHFYACAQDASYAAEHFGVAVSTAGNTSASDFVMIDEWTMTAKRSNVEAVGRGGQTRQGTWYEYTADLSAYAGQEFWLAIRHFGCTDMFLLNIDDIELAGMSSSSKLITATVNPSNAGFVSGAGYYDEGSICTLRATAASGYSFLNWTLNGVEVSTTSTYVFTVTENATYVANFTYNGNGDSYTTYDWQSNSGAITRTVVWPDGTVNFAYTQARNQNFSDRGTGISTYNAVTDSWSHTSERVEGTKSGFGSIARYGANGLVLASHTANDCRVYIIDDKNNIVPNSLSNVAILDNTYEPAWPNVMTSGPNRDIIHVIAFSYVQASTGLEYQPLYFRSQDGGQTWDKQNFIIPYTGSDYCSGWNSNKCYWMETTDDNCLALVVNNPWSDGMVIYSYDNGNTWQRKVFYQHPGINNNYDEMLLYPRYTSCQWDSNHKLHILYEFNGTTGAPGSGSFYPGIGGVAYWNEDMPYNINGTTNGLTPGQPFAMTADYINYDIYQSCWYWSDPSHTMWPEYIGYIPPLDNDGNPEDPYNNNGLNVSELTNHGAYNSGICGFPVLCMDNATGTMVAVWSAMDENNTDIYGINYYKLFASCSTDNGATWTSQVALTNDPVFTNFEFVWPQAAIVNGKLVVAVQTDNETGTFVLSDESVYDNNYYECLTYELSDLFEVIPTTHCIITASINPVNSGYVTGAGYYPEGATCTLTATANPGYTFVNWTKGNEVVSTNAAYTFIVTEDSDFVANFTTASYTITVAANPTVGGVVAGGGTFSYGEACTIAAVANSGYEFVNWTNNGTVVSTNSTYTFNVTGSETYIANFALIYEITAVANPTEGGMVAGAGTYMLGNVCTLVAIANQGYSFVNWTKDNVIVSEYSTYSFTVTEAGDYVANFVVETYLITAEANPSTSGVVAGGGTFAYGETCTLAAMANEGYTFINWTKNNNVVSTNMVYTFTVEESGNYVANFELNTYEITVNANPEEAGMVVGGGTFGYGSTCSIIAIANPGYTFVNWTKGNEVVSTNVAYTFTVTEAADYVANFETPVETFEIVLLADCGTPIGAGIYEYGQECTISIDTSDCFDLYFANWTENGVIVSEDSEFTIIVTANHEFVANFYTGVDEYAEMSVVMYPNPASEKVIFETSEAVRRCEVYNINGALVYSMTECSENFEINVSDFAAGSYIVRLVSDNSVQTRRFTKK